ncbi:phosphatidylinositol-3-phosphate-binding ubiquitin-protein ligase ASCRUDRAFT_35734 [Ascoidea rubescens DSM 1968]|uniref:FYVE-domain-containing protein n=1 Tax=Ascoidea rubescens DSM 1968 TaxID=1344418 RepID=A0A1D2VFG0_9ASCO|nr:hypothetical protein ASCRUDRAFT_35734 [Ascoidea rubescens DSM 1968]ODV60418.1 hypothetical protein ASCRUDRAFT_35734 [Ascoidea rubescens DSM 1968]
MSNSPLDQSTQIYSWQPDNSTNKCTLCSKLFSLFFRRHHCRKCGKIICSTCSKHYTDYLPTTYVVSPPSQMFLENPHVPHRTCDVCFNELIMIKRALILDISLPSNSTTTTSTTTTNLSPATNLSNTNNISANNNTQTTNTLLTHLLNSNVQSNTQNNPNHYLFNANHITNLIKTDPFIDNNSTTNTSFLSDKENHINSCIEKAQFSGSPDQKRLINNRMLVYRIPKYEKIKTNKFNKFNETNKTNKTNKLDQFNENNQISLQSNFENECVICFEEFRPGDKVGRLECLCVFHYKCIKDWFDIKGPGECPVHAVHY